MVNLHVLFVLYIAACECNNHADSCTYNETKGYGVCNDCKHNTIGDNCELCKVSFYRNATVPQNDINTCLGKFTIFSSLYTCVSYTHLNLPFWQSNLLQSFRIHSHVVTVHMCKLHTFKFTIFTKQSFVELQTMHESLWTK